MLVINLPHDEAKKFFLKNTSYFTSKLPDYINFENTLNNIDKVLEQTSFENCKSSNPADFDKVNYCLLTNKDGKNAWRALELIHPLIYVSLVRLITDEKNWNLIQNKLSEFRGEYIECCSQPEVSENDQSDTAAQVKKWLRDVEQKSLTYSLNYKYLLQTDVTDCYGSLYTHSISWALHGYSDSKELKKNKKAKKLAKQLGDQIDFYIGSGRYGQTNGISQGSVLMDFIAEIVLSYVDSLINAELERYDFDIKILRYRDDYKIFSNNEDISEQVLKTISDQLCCVGMKLNASKTFFSKNIIESSIKPDKFASISLPHLRFTKSTSLQKHLLKLHAFGLCHPNSGALRRLLSDLHKKIASKNLPSQVVLEHLEVQVAIAIDIAFTSPSTLPYVVGILSHLIGHASDTLKTNLINKVLDKMKRVPNNGYLEIWLQRFIAPSITNHVFDSAEKICQIVGQQNIVLWESAWVKNKAVLEALKPKNIVSKNASDSPQKIDHKEVALFHYDS